MTADFMTARDPGEGFTSAKAKHPESLPGQPREVWCQLTEREQTRTVEFENFRARLAWDCRKRVEGGVPRETVIPFYRYMMRHYEIYLNLLEMAPKYKGARGMGIAHGYLARQARERTLILQELVMENLVADKRALACLRRSSEPLLVEVMGAHQCHCYRCDLADPKLDGGWHWGPGPVKAERRFDSDFQTPMRGPA